MASGRIDDGPARAEVATLPNGSRFHFLLPLVAAAALAISPAHAGTASPPQWAFDSQGDVAFLRLTPLGSLLAGGGGRLWALDPADGHVLWERDGLAGPTRSTLEILPLSTRAVHYLAPGTRGNFGNAEVLDLETGQPAWTDGSLATGTLGGLLFAPHRQVLIGYAHPGDDAAPTWAAPSRTGWTWIAVDAASGRRLWSRDSLLAFPPALFNFVDPATGLVRPTFDGHQPPVFDTDSTFVLCMSRDGVVRSNLLTGERLWRVPLPARAPPTLSADFAPMRLDRGILYVPSARRLLALRAADGTAVWANPDAFPSKIVQMQMTPAGLLVRGSPSYDEHGHVRIAGPRPDWQDMQERATANTGEPFLQLLDPASGRPRWAAPFKLGKRTTPFVVRGNTAYLVDGDRLLAILLPGGESAEVAKVAFEDGEKPQWLENRPGGLLVGSSQDLDLVEPSGHHVYQQHFRAPRAPVALRAGGALLTATSVALYLGVALASTYGSPNDRPLELPVYVSPEVTRRYRASREVRDDVAILTHVNDAQGHLVPGLVRVNKDTGEVLSQQPLNDRTPEYEWDAIERRLFFLGGARRIECRGF